MTEGRKTGHSQQKWRAAVLSRDGHTCQACGLYDPTDDLLIADHIIELADGGPHTEANGQALCHVCHTKKSVTNHNQRMKDRKSERKSDVSQPKVFRHPQGHPGSQSVTVSPDVPDVRQEVDGALVLDLPDPAEVTWDPGDLDRILTWGAELPGPDDIWPRIMSAPHPESVGSYGRGAIEWMEARTGRELRWFQRLTVVRALEHRADGSLVWETVLLSMTRQVGKSYLLRELLLWRMEHMEIFSNPEPDALIYVSNHMEVSKEVWRPAMAWADTQPGWKIRQANGEQRIENRAGARWLVRAAAHAGTGFTLAGAVIDECWDIDSEVIDDRISPAMIEPSSAQLYLVSTAHPEATPLFPTERKAALAVLRQPGDTLIMEWSASPGRDSDDRDGWREASPFWNEKRRTFIARRRQTAASDESFRAQWLNIWPSSTRRTLTDEDSWAELMVPGLEIPSDPRPVWMALDGISGGGASLVIGWPDSERRVCLSPVRPGPLLRALTKATELAAAHPGSVLLLGASLDKMVDRESFPGEVQLAGVRETRQATHLFQGLLAERRICHNGDPALAAQVQAAVIVPTESGPVMSGTRSPVPVDLVRGSLWVSWAVLTQVSTTPEIF